jgi:hypothetical protein
LSSILTALKKLEKNAPQQSDQSDWKSKVNPNVYIPRKVGRSWRKHRLIKLAGFFILIIAAGWLYTKLNIKPLSFTSVSAPKPNLPEEEEKPNRGAALLSPSVDSTLPVSQKSNPEKSLKAPPADSASANMPASRLKTGQSAKPTTNRPPAPPRPRKKESALKPDRPPVQRQAALQDSKNTDASFAASAKRQPSMTNAAPKISPTDASVPEYTAKDRFDIQAIAWDENPQDRLVVINNSILREGGSIDGVSISQIGKNEIIINDKGQRWKILFIRP